MSAVGIVGGVISLIGAGVQFGAQQDMIRRQTNISKRAENVRAQQMQLDAARRKRASIRSGLIQRAMSVSNAANQGALASSGAQAGATAGAANAAEGAQSVNQGTILGLRQFKNNKDYFDVTQNGQFWMGVGGGISSIGGAIMGNAGQISALAGIGAPTQGPGGTGGGPGRTSGWG